MPDSDGASGAKERSALRESVPRWPDIMRNPLTSNPRRKASARPPALCAPVVFVHEALIIGVNYTGTEQALEGVLRRIL